jgi:hypothetical protein
VVTCETCGREDGHFLGCGAAQGGKSESERARTHESECIKDGCTNPRAVSKGPRPAKYCDEHKTGAKKS